MWSSSSRDNWERLVAAVVKKQQIWELCHQQSRSPSISTISSLDDFSFSSINLDPFSVSPSISQDKASSRPFTRNLLSAYRRGKSKDQDLIRIPEGVAIHLRLLRRFSLRELRIATEDFSKESVIRRYVYRGCLADGSPVAVKRRYRTSFTEAQFQREVQINSIASHQNVLGILGFCLTRDEQLLVYPLMVNGSVLSCTREKQKSQPPLNWPARKGIALGAARGLAYLHEDICDKKIIHRDIKAANILLDKDFKAVVADFGSGIIAEHNTSYVQDAVYGTIGHIAPEYLATGKCSEKNDVFGYGVFLLELITGQRAFDLTRLHKNEDLLLESEKRKCKERTLQKMVDTDCESDYMEDVVKPLLQIALLCTETDPDQRPKMSEVVAMIEDRDIGGF